MKAFLKITGLLAIVATLSACEGMEISAGGYDPSAFEGGPAGFASPFGFGDGFPAPIYGAPQFGYYGGGFPGYGWGGRGWGDDDD